MSGCCGDDCSYEILSRRTKHGEASAGHTHGGGHCGGCCHWSLILTISNFRGRAWKLELLLQHGDQRAAAGYLGSGSGRRLMRFLLSAYWSSSCKLSLTASVFLLSLFSVPIPSFHFLIPLNDNILYIQAILSLLEQQTSSQPSQYQLIKQHFSHLWPKLCYPLCYRNTLPQVSRVRLEKASILSQFLPYSFNFLLVPLSLGLGIGLDM